MTELPREADEGPEDPAVHDQGRKRWRRAGRSVPHGDSAGWPGTDDDSPDWLAEFSRRCDGARVDYLLTSEGIEVIEVSYRDPQVPGEQPVPRDSPAGRKFAEVLLNLLAAASTQAASGLAGVPTGLDTAADSVALVLRPQVIAAKIANAAVQAIAHHVGLVGPAAAVLGLAAEREVSQWLGCGDALARGVDDLRAVNVALDLADGQFTPDVRDLAVDKAVDKLAGIVIDGPENPAASLDPPGPAARAALPIVILEQEPADGRLLPWPEDPSLPARRPSVLREPPPPADDQRRPDLPWQWEL